jgi:uncharacterized membrane protein HdeD (DUF308 family)
VVLTFVWPLLFGIGLIVAPGAGALALVWVIGLYAIIAAIIYIALALRLRKRSPAGA